MHPGALGDTVLVWPLLRAIARAGHVVMFAARPSHARLASTRLGAPLTAIDIEHSAINAIWREAAPESPRLTADLLLSFVEPDPARLQLWTHSAQRILAASDVQLVGPPGSASRSALWKNWNVASLGGVPLRANSRGPIVIHIGAGSREKSWPLEHALELVTSLAQDGHQISLVAGEVESDRLPAHHRSQFIAFRGRFVDSLETLADTIQSARLFIGADTGPSHLAAQLGIPTLALFGPSDPAVWAPVGPCVRTLAPPEPSPMTWLSPQAALVAARAMLIL